MRQLVLSALRRAAFQPLWAQAQRISLVLMNFWSSHVAHDGEIDAFRDLSKRFPDDAVLVDVGANVGDYSALMLARGPRVRVHAFEPSAAAFARLEQRHGATPQVRLNRLALSSEPGTSILHSDSEGSTIGSLETLASPIRPFDARFDEEVRCSTLDLYCAEQGIERIHFLKLDVEGHELSVLRGAQGLLERGAIDAVQWEFGENNVSSRTFLADFVTVLAGYDFYRVVPGGLVPWTYDGGRSEIFATMNYVAVRRAG